VGVARYCNDAQQRLLMDPMAPDEGWWAGTVTLNLSVDVFQHHAHVVTPREIGRLTNLAVCKKPVPVRNKFYEYLQFGRGVQPPNCSTGWCGNLLQAYERDTTATMASFPTTPQKLRFYPTDGRDAGLRILPQGLDQNKVVVLCTDPSTGLSAQGEYVALQFPFSDTLNIWSRITGFQKDETYGPVQIFTVDPNTGTEKPLSFMETNEMVANYRRYLINGIPNPNLCCQVPGIPLQISGQGRLDFIPVQNETDYLLIQNVPALVEESQSIRYSRMDGGAAKSQYHHGRALQLLNGQIDAHEGKTNVSISVPIFGSARLRRQPV
jgi:hypothetical protein